MPDATLTPFQIVLVFGIAVLLFSLLIGLLYLVQRRIVAEGGPRPALDQLIVAAPPGPPVAVAAPHLPVTDAPLPLIQWLPIVQRQLDEHPHLIIYARTGAGKTTLVKALMQSRPGQFWYLSPKSGEFGAQPYPTVQAIDGEASYQPIETGLQAVLREYTQRLTLGVTHPHAPLTVVIDDYATVKLKCPSAPKVLFELGTIGRSLRMRLIIITTTKRVKGLGLDGLGDALHNFVEIELPKDTARVSGFLTIDERAPVPISLDGVLELSQQPIAPTRWWTPPVSVPAPAMADSEPVPADTRAGTSVDTTGWSEEREAILAKALRGDPLSANDWVVLLAENRNKTLDRIRRLRDASQLATTSSA